MTRFIAQIILITGLHLPLSLIHAQPDDQPGLDDVTDFDIDFGFEEDLFEDPFAGDEEEQDSWLDGFTVRLSQQFFGQVNNHGVDLAPGFSFPREAEVENNRFGINVRYQNNFAAGWLLQASAQSRVYWKEDYEYRANGDSIETESRVNEFFVQRSFGQHSLKFGRQTVVWGETVGNSVLDVININEFRDFTIIDIEDARLNQWMLVWDFFGENRSQWSTFINLYPEFNPAPVRGSPLFFDPGFHMLDYDRNNDVLVEVGTQYRRTFEGSDVAVMAAYLYENQLRWDPPTSPMSQDGIPRINDFILLGFSANRAIGRVLLNFDLAFSHDIQQNSFNFPGASSLANPIDLKKDQIGTSFGFEWAIDNEQSMSLGIQAQKILDEKQGLQPGQALVNEGVFGSWLIRYSNSMRNGDLVLSSTLQGDLEAESLLALVGLDYILNDNWSVSGQVISITATGETPLIFFDEDLRVGATLSYSF